MRGAGRLDGVGRTELLCNPQSRGLPRWDAQGPFFSLPVTPTPTSFEPYSKEGLTLLTKVRTLPTLPEEPPEKRNVHFHSITSVS